MISFDIADEIGREVSQKDDSVLDVPIWDGMLGQHLRGRVRLEQRLTWGQSGPLVEQRITPVKEVVDVWLP